MKTIQAISLMLSVAIFFILGVVTWLTPAESDRTRDPVKNRHDELAINVLCFVLSLSIIVFVVSTIGS